MKGYKLPIMYSPKTIGSRITPRATWLSRSNIKEMSALIKKKKKKKDIN